MVSLELLKSIGFLQNLEDFHLHRIASISELQEVPAQTVIFRQGELCPSIYLIVQGEVILEIAAPGHPSAQVHTLGAGELLGWSPLVGPTAMTATARTVNPCRLVVIDSAQFLAFCEHYPEFGMELLRRAGQTLARRLKDTRQELLADNQPRQHPQ